LEEYLVTNVKGDMLRHKLITLLDNGKFVEFEDLLKLIAHLSENQSDLEAFESHFMGGNYLTNLKHAEVEIAGFL
jgi:hypothetical protein